MHGIAKETRWTPRWQEATSSSHIIIAEAESEVAGEGLRWGGFNDVNSYGYEFPFSSKTPWYNWGKEKLVAIRHARKICSLSWLYMDYEPTGQERQKPHAISECRNRNPALRQAKAPFSSMLDGSAISRKLRKWQTHTRHEAQAAEGRSWEEKIA